MEQKNVQSRLLLLLIFCLALSFEVRAQEQEEYKMEAGAGLALTAYWGDFNGNVMKGFQPGVTALVKRTFNPYSALSFQLLKGKLKGTSQGVNTYYPSYINNVYSFDVNLIDVAFVYEYNFYPYGTGLEYRGAKRITPYVCGGLGVTSVWGNTHHATAVNVPLGVGLKYKMTERLNLAIEYSVRLTGSDKLDGVKDPYAINSSGLFKNTDGYSAFRVTLSYSFMPKCKTCHNDND